MPAPSSDDPRPGPRPSWNSGRGTPGAQNNPEGWRATARRNSSDRDRGQKISHTVKVLAWAGASCLLLGALIYFLIGLMPRRPAVVAVTAAGYAFPWPANAWGVEDAEAFKILDKDTLDFRDSSTRIDTQAGGLNDANLAQAVNDFTDLMKDRRSPVGILYLNAHGALNDAGEPCLLRVDAPPSDAASWYRLRDLFALLAKQPWVGKTPVVVVLDSAKLDVCWPAGIVLNGFADKLRDVVAKENIPRLTVVCTASGTERAWASPHLQGSVFGHYFALGLSGEADRKLDGGNEDGWVTFGEFRRYVDRRVDTWVAANRGDGQHPFWIFPREGSDDDFRFIRVQGSGMYGKPGKVARALAERIAAARGASTDSESEWEKAWSFRTRLLAASERIEPAWQAQWEQRLIWAEEASLAGGSYSGTAVRIRNELIAAADEKLQPPKDLPKDLLSVPMLEAFAPRDPAPFRVAARRAVQEALQAPTREALLKAVEAPGDVPKAMLPGLIELHYARMLGVFAPESAFRSGRVRASLDLRNLAEQAAVPPSVRAAPYVRGPTAQGDLARRRGEDRLFLGEAEDLERADREFDAAAVPYRKARKVGEDVARAYELRDRAWSDLPQYAFWLSNPRWADAAGSEAERTELLEQAWKPGLAAAHQLTNLLAEAPAENPDVANILAESATLRTALGRLQQHFDKTVSDILQVAGGDHQTLRRISAVLTVPLVGPQQRAQMRAQWLKISVLKQQDTLVASGEAAQGTAGPVASQAAARLPADADYVPPPLILVRQSAGGTAAAPVADAEGGARAAPEDNAARRVELLVGYGKEIRQGVRDGDAAVGKLVQQSEAALAVDRNLASAVRPAAVADAAARRIAPLTSAPPRDTADRLRRVRTYELLLDQAARTILDGWGPEPGARFESNGRLAEIEAAFFYAGAGRYAASAKAALGGSVSAAFPGAQQLDDLRTRQRDLLEKHLSLILSQPSPILGFQESSGDQQTDVAQDWQVRYSNKLPEAVAALGVRTSEGAGLDVPMEADGRQRFRLPLDLQDRDTADPEVVGKRLRVRYPLDAFPSLKNQAAGYCLLRGHLRTVPFEVTRTGEGIELWGGPIRLSPPRLGIKEDRAQRRHFIFLIDSSHSMITLEKGEGGLEQSRLAWARNSLKAVLETMVGRKGDEPGPSAVSVYFFAHRAGWKNSPKGLVPTYNPNWTRRIEQGVNPANDIEPVHPDLLEETLRGPRGGFRRSELEKLDGLLARLEPWGSTPLYYSIRQAVQDNAAGILGTGAGKPIVIVLTDGVNDVQIPAGSNIELVTPEKVVDAARGKAVINIVGFQLTADAELRYQRQADPAEFAKLRPADLEERRNTSRLKIDAARAAYEEITRETGGKFFSAADVQALQRDLNSLVVPEDYELKLRGETLVKSALGTQIELDRNKEGRLPRDYKFEPGEYVVQVPGPASTTVKTEPLDLVGGEILDMELSADRRNFKFLQGAQGELVSGPPVEDPRKPDQRYVISAHPPQRSGSTVVLPISIRRAEDDQFTRSPRGVWLEVVPKPGEGRANRVFPKYVLYDLLLKDGRYVPQFEFRLPNWPTDAKQAEIRVWFQYSPPEGAEFTPAEARDPVKMRELFPQKLEVRVRELHIDGTPHTVVDVIHPSEAGDPFAYKLEPAHVDETLVRISRSFDEVHQVARHRFTFRAEQPQVMRYHFRYVPQKLLKENAIRLRDPLRVSIPEATAGVGG